MSPGSTGAGSVDGTIKVGFVVSELILRKELGAQQFLSRTWPASPQVFLCLGLHHVLD